MHYGPIAGTHVALPVPTPGTTDELVDGLPPKILVRSIQNLTLEMLDFYDDVHLRMARLQL
jgi:hypothetical protein